MAKWLQWFQASLAGFLAEPAEVLSFARTGPFLASSWRRRRPTSVGLALGYLNQWLRPGRWDVTDQLGEAGTPLCPQLHLRQTCALLGHCLV